MIYDTSQDALAPLAARGATVATSAADVASKAEVVFLSLPTPPVVQAVVTGEGGVLQGTMVKTLVDLSTTGPSVAAICATASAGRGVAWMDSPVSGGITGAIGGFTGPLPTLWATLRGWPKDELRSVIQNFNLVTLAVIFFSYLATGVVTRAMWPAFAWVAPALLIPVLLGARLYAGISPEAFRRIVLTLLALSGAALLVRSVPAVWGRIGG